MAEQKAPSPDRQTRTGRPGLFRRFRADRRGAAAIEFAIVSIPFFALVFAIIETAIVFFAGQVLDTAVADAARLIRTGQVQQAATTKEDFRADVCERLSGMFDCGSRLFVDVQTFADFQTVAAAPPLDEDEEEFDEDDEAYAPGAAGEIVVVRVYYAWPVIFDFFGFDLSNMAGGNRLLGSVATFRNEPFPWSNPFA